MILGLDSPLTGGCIVAWKSSDERGTLADPIEFCPNTLYDLKEELKMIETKEKLRNIIAFSWTGMLFANLASFIMRIIINGAESLGEDAGIAWVMVVFFYIFILMPISVKTFEATAFRWTVFVLTVLYTLPFSAHFFASIFIFNTPASIVMLFALIPILSIWGAVAAFKWARLQE